MPLPRTGTQAVKDEFLADCTIRRTFLFCSTGGALEQVSAPVLVKATKERTSLMLFPNTEPKGGKR